MSVRFNLALIFMALMLVIYFGGYCRFSVFGSAENDAVAAIAATEEYIVLCYDVVLEAEGVGANITALRIALAKAGTLLSRAELSFRSDDFNSTILFSSQSQEELLGLTVEAEALSEIAAAKYYWDFLITIVGSGVGAIVIICGSFVLWHLLDKKYGRSSKI